MECVFSVLQLTLVFIACIILYTQSQRTTTPDPDELEKPVIEICQFLIDTDNTLVEKYSAKPKGDGEAIMKLVRTYNDNLRLLVQSALMEKRNNRTMTTAIEAKPLIDHGGPQFINFYVDPPLLEERFGLNNISSRILHCQRQNTIDIWEEFYTIYSKIPDEDDVSIDDAKARGW